jgi:hypothetical protein
MCTDVHISVFSYFRRDCHLKLKKRVEEEEIASRVITDLTLMLVLLDPQS